MSIDLLRAKIVQEGFDIKYKEELKVWNKQKNILEQSDSRHMSTFWGSVTRP